MMAPDSDDEANSMAETPTESIEDQIESVHVLVQARNGALETTEVYVDGETAIKRYSELSSDKRHIKTLLEMNAEIEDLDV